MRVQETFSSAIGYENRKIFRSLYRRLLHEANYLDTHPLVKCLLPLPKHLKTYCGDASSLYTLNGRSYVKIVKSAFLASFPEKEHANTTEELDSISCESALKDEKPYLKQLYQRYFFLSSAIPGQLSEASFSTNHRDTTVENINFGKLLRDSFDALQRMREHKEWCCRHLPVLMYHRSAVYDEIEQQDESLFLLPDSSNEDTESKYERLRLPLLVREFLMKSVENTGTEPENRAENSTFTSFPNTLSSCSPPLFLSYLMKGRKNIQNTNLSFSEKRQRTHYSEKEQWKDKNNYFKENFFSSPLKGLEHQKKKKNKLGLLPPAFRLWAEPLVWAPSPSFSSSQAISSPVFYDPDMPWGVGTPATHLSASFNKPYSDFEGSPLLTASTEEREPSEKLSATAPDHHAFHDVHSICDELGTTETEQRHSSEGKGSREQASQKRVRSCQCRRNEQSPISIVIVSQKGMRESREGSTSFKALSASSSGCESRSETSSTSSYVPSDDSNFPVVSFFTGSFSSSSKAPLPTAEILPAGLLPGTVLLAHPCSPSFTSDSRVLLITKRSSVFTTGISLDAECLHSISEKHPIFPEMFWGHPIRNGGAKKTSTTLPPTPNITVLHTLGVPPASSSLKSKERLQETEAACKCHSCHCEPLILPGHRGENTQSTSIFYGLKEKRKTLDNNLLQNNNYFKKKVLEKEMEEAEESESRDGFSIGATPTLFMSKVESLPYLATLIAQHDCSSKTRNFHSRSPSTVSRRAVHVFWGCQRFSTTQLEEDVKAGQWIPVQVSPCFLYAAASFQPSGFSSTRPLPFPSEDSLYCSPSVSTAESFNKCRKSHGRSSLPGSGLAGKRDPLQDYFPSKEMLVEMKKRREKGWFSSKTTTSREKTKPLNSSTTTLTQEEEPSSLAWSSFLARRNESDTYLHSSSILHSPSSISEDTEDAMNEAELAELLEDEEALSWSHEWKKDEIAESKKSVPLWDVLLYALGGEYRSLIGFGVADKTRR